MADWHRFPGSRAASMDFPALGGPTISMLFSIDPLADLEVTNAVRRIHIAEALSYRRINPLLVYFVFETPEGEASSSAPQIVYWILLIIGVAGAVAGFVVKPKKGVQE